MNDAVRTEKTGTLAAPARGATHSLILADLDATVDRYVIALVDLQP